MSQHEQQEQQNASRNIDREWSIVQKKTFTKWVNTKLNEIGVQVVDLQQDFCDGVNLLNLLSIIGAEPIKFNKTPKLRIHKVENLNKALEFIKGRGVHLTNIGAEDILDGNEKLILGLVWVVILRFSIAEISEGDLSAKEGLLLWCQRKTAGYKDVSVKDFTGSWQDGLALCALIHRHRPDLLNFASLEKGNKAKNVELAFEIAASKLNIPRLLDVEDLVDTIKPDERSLMTYIAQYFHAFSNLGKFETAARRIDQFGSVVEQIFDLQTDYEKRARQFIQSIDGHIESWKNAEFDGTYANAKNQSNDLISFKNKEKRQLVTEKRQLDTLLGDVNTKRKTYNLKPYFPPEEVKLEVVDAKWEALLSAEIDRRVRINKKITEIKDQLRLNFAVPANKLERELNRISGELGNLENDLESQLQAANKLNEQVSVAEKNLEEIEAANQLLIEAHIEENDHTVYSVDDLIFDLTLLKQSLTRKIAFIENQIAARGISNVTPQQLEEFESTFRHFDRNNSNNLSALEFKAAISALGVAIDENFDALFAQVSGNSDAVNFQNFVSYLKDLTEDKTSANQLKEAFSTLANSKEAVSEADLAMVQNNFFKLQLKDGKFDYQEFLDSVFA